MNSITKLRKSTGLNRRQFCEKYNIPYMTMTDWELGKHQAPDYVLRMLAYYVQIQDMLLPEPYPNREECHVWEEQKNYRTTFPVTVKETANFYLKYIYPTKQKTALRLHEFFKSEPKVASAIMFGSSVTMRCNKDSDIDLSISLYKDFQNSNTRNEISEQVLEICDWKADLIWMDHLSKDELLYKNIITQGVKLI